MKASEILKVIRHTGLCEISLGWAAVCDCGAEKYRQELKREVEATAE